MLASPPDARSTQARPGPVLLENVAFVLHRPSSAENIGAVARALKNFGLSSLVLVEPPGWAGPARSGAGHSGGEDVLLRARRTARHAADLLERAERHADLRAALAGAIWACGTTSRAPEGREALSPRLLAAEVARRSPAGPVAVVLGEERRGLSDAELSLCQAVCAIPTDPGYGSMNLAQAAAVLAYEISLARGGAPPPAPRAEPARGATVEALFRELAALLAAAGYLNPQNPDAILREWRRLLARAEPTQREIEILTAGLKALKRGGR